MPTYEYKREDGSTFEIEQRITQPALTECPTTGQKVKRIITGGAGLVFKGTGFYQTDYVRKPTGGSNSESASKSETSSSSETKSDAATTPSKPAPSKSSE